MAGKARWTMEVTNTVHLIYKGVRHKTWRRSDGGMVRRRLPLRDSLVTNWWLHYCEETGRKLECGECFVNVAPAGQAVQVTVRLREVATLVDAPVM